MDWGRMLIMVIVLLCCFVGFWKSISTLYSVHKAIQKSALEDNFDKKDLLDCATSIMGEIISMLILSVGIGFISFSIGVYYAR